MNTIDKLDKKILLELIKNSRVYLTTLSKKVRSSREVVNYRITMLRKRGIIKDFVTEIDYTKMGFVAALLFIRVKSDREKEFIDYLKTLNFVSWAGTHLGLWSLGMAIYGKDNKDIEQKFQSIYQKFHDGIIDHRLEFYKNTKTFYEKYLGLKNNHETKSEQLYKADKVDKLLLKNLSNDSRISSVELSKLLNLSITAIIRRIKNLEKSGIIKKYSLYLDLSKIGLYQFVFFINNKNLENRKKLYAHLESHPQVSLLIDYIGDPFIEFGIFVSNPYDARLIAQKIEDTFSDNRIVDFFMAQEEFITQKVPACVFS